MNANPLCRLPSLRPFPRFFVLLILVLCLSSCAIVHRYDAFTRTVVDAETGAPIEGAAVLATYYTIVYTPAGQNGWYLMTQETLTDKEGRFEIPGNTAWTFLPLSTFDPRLHFTIFKPGYDCYTSYSEILLQRAPSAQEVVISLHKLKTFEERKQSTRCTPVSVPREDYPILLKSLNEECSYLGVDQYPVTD